MCGVSPNHCPTCHEPLPAHAPHCTDVEAVELQRIQELLRKLDVPVPDDGFDSVVDSMNGGDEGGRS